MRAHRFLVGALTFAACSDDDSSHGGAESEAEAEAESEAEAEAESESEAESEAEAEAESEGEESDVAVETLGQLQFPADELARVAVSAPDNSDSFMLIVEAAENVYLFPKTVVTPSGQTIWDIEAYDQAVQQGSTSPLIAPFSSDYYVNPLVIQVPMSPELPLAAGEYHYNIDAVLGNLNDTAWTGSFKIIKKAATQAERMRLDVVHHFVSGSGLNATDAQSDADFQEVLQVYSVLLEKVGLEVQSVGFEDVDDDELTSIDTEEEFGRLLSLAPDGRTLHLFYVEQLFPDENDGGYVLGTAGGIPGPATIGQTSASGVAVTLLDLRNDSALVGFTAAHETLHFFGLFHTTEQNGVVTEPIGDTPSCPRENDIDGDALLNSYECAEQGALNLMFWLAPPEEFDEPMLSEGQAYVVQRNPLAIPIE